MDHHRAVVLLRQRRLVGSTEVAAPLDRQAFGLQRLDRFVVRDPGKRLLDRFELRDVALDDRELTPPLLEDATDHGNNQILGQIHHVVQIRVRHLRLDHPELGQMPPCFRFLGTERRAETVDAAERHRIRFVVQLPALRQVRGLVVEILRRKQSRRAFAGRRRKDRRIGEDESARVEEIAHGIDDFVADPKDCLLPFAANPQMASIEQVVDPVLLRRNWIIVRLADDLDARDVDLVTAGRALVGAGRAGHDDGRFLREMVRGLEHLVANGGFRHDRLDEAGPVADDQEMNLAARSAVVQPSLDDDFFALVAADIFYIDVHTSYQLSGSAESYLISRERYILLRAVFARASVSFAEPRTSASNMSDPS